MDPATNLYGLELRYVLTDIITGRGGPCTTAELARTLTAAGFELGGRPSKVVSDALRWEVRRGRVHHLGRARYGPGSIPGSTRRRIRIRSAARWAGLMNRVGG